MMFSSAVKYIIITAALTMASIVIEGFTPEGGGMLNGPPFVLIEGEGSHQGKVGFTPLYPDVNPTPHWLPVPHWCETQIPGRY